MKKESRLIDVLGHSINHLKEALSLMKNGEFRKDLLLSAFDDIEHIKEQEEIEVKMLRDIREKSTKELMNLWDSLDADEDIIEIEFVHQVLNDRGSGEYCAI